MPPTFALSPARSMASSAHSIRYWYMPYSTTRSPSHCCLIQVPHVPCDPRYRSAFRDQSRVRCPQELYDDAWEPGGGALAHPTGLPGGGGHRCGVSASGGVYRAPACSLHRWLLGGDFLEHFTLTLDYRTKRLQLPPALSGRRGD